MAEPVQPFWKTLAEAAGTIPAPTGEFPAAAQEPMAAPAEGPSRRRFLGLLGASAALAAGAGCKSQIDRGPIIPYTKRPDEVVPGVANFYASTFQEGASTYGVLVKAREGRPIHVEGNDEHPLARGKAPGRAIADLLSLYDSDRLRAPMIDGKAAAWTDALERLAAGVKEAAGRGQDVLLVTGAVTSPTLGALIAELGKAVPTLRHVAFEPAADQAAARAAREAFGEARVTRMRFDRASAVLSLGADFLGTMDGAVQAVAQFSASRKPKDLGSPMSRLWVFEGPMTLTGSKADHRLPVRPSALAKVGFAIARVLHEKHAVAYPGGLLPQSLPPLELAKVADEQHLDPVLLEALATDLARNVGSALAVAGPGAPPEAHLACHLLNAMLQAEGQTLETAQAPAAPALATRADLTALTREMSQGKIGAAIVWGPNPAYELPGEAGWPAAYAKVPVRARLSLLSDETAAASQIVLPINHWLESWGDFEASGDLLSLRQPLIAPLFESRQAEDVLLGLVARLGASVPGDYHAYLRRAWQRSVYPDLAPVSFEAFWNASVHDGIAHRPAVARPPAVFHPAPVVGAAAAAFQGAPATGFELVLVPDAKVYDGRYANNGWLQELPDPVTKVTWGNPVLISVADAARLGLEIGDEVKLEAGGRVVIAPVMVQPGQAAGVLSIALGYGRTAGSIAAGVGVSAWPLFGLNPGAPLLPGVVTLTPAGTRGKLVRTQEHHRLEGRDLARLWTRAQYAQGSGPEHAAHVPMQSPAEGGGPASLYPEGKYPDQKWGMAIDLSGCVGCSACVIACQSENNVPVVGPEQVEKGREMAWLRIDTYYQGPPEAPRVVNEPMLCQHCENAPCENVCPVGATNHSPDGLNQMLYNRCVGTRYCANNCPFKVRRFNFFELNQQHAPVRELAFNPEVTVRPRGVMEKCSFCVQRISNAKQVAKGEGRRIRDGEVKPACAVACPAEAITFGDLRDPGSRVAQLAQSDRGFHVLGELGVRPVITYLADLRNPASEDGE